MFVWPDWIVVPRTGDSPLTDQGRKRTRFLLRVAALHASEEGTLTELSALAGHGRNTLPSYAGRGDPITPETAAKIEELTHGVCKACWFRPDILPVRSR